MNALLDRFGAAGAFLYFGLLAVAGGMVVGWMFFLVF
jgi:hypothetical protein